MRITPRLPFQPLEPYLPVSNLARVLGTNQRLIRNAKSMGLQTFQAENWCRKLNLNPADIWPEMADPIAFRFWSGVDRGADDECWPWMGDTGGGYGIFCVGKTKYRAHVMALTLTTGESSGQRITCHSCDNPICANPLHLRFGSYQDNSNDCVSRGRHAHGERNGHSVLSETAVEEIRNKYADGIDSRTLVKYYGVSQGAIAAIVRGDRWARVSGPTIKGRSPGRPRKR